MVSLPWRQTYHSSGVPEDGARFMDLGSSDGEDDCLVHPDKVAKAKVMGLCVLMEKGCCFVEKRSIYGAVILMPQLARSMEWPGILTFEAIRSHVLLALDLILQLFIVMMVSKHENVMNGFSGQMFLCDLGAGCTDNTANSGPACTGPAGTDITPGRTYSFDIWNARQFVKSSLLAVFPGQADVINKNVDPGEYAMESYSCRWLCCLLFMMSMMQELQYIVDMAYLVYWVPSADESWVHFKHEDAGEEQNGGSAWYDDVELTIAGMPRKWKISIILFVLCPKILIWQFTCRTGTVFLMESAAIDDLIVNSVALTFILTLSETICETLTSEITHDMLSRCKDFPLFDEKTEQNLTDDEIVQKYTHPEEMRPLTVLDFVKSLLPLKMIGVLVLTVLFVLDYYRSHCTYHSGLVFLPNPLYIAKTSQYSILNFFFPSWFPLEREEGAEWMPSNMSY
eukprot:TRINITY_DN28331_c0_g1_i1.p1 TRINITY_DN28331_c0_g1~~TRINITY_DN28331_c0_g1_i1.p1  ORF type:complete len:453 (+),score=75.90 TRINITY_DN28331_c0_g1_i1:47-1405(+)